MLPTVYSLSTDQVVKAAGGWLTDILHSSSEPCLFLLSGGSAVASYGGLADALSGDHANVAFGLIDERFGAVGHEHSNAVAIAQATDLWRMCDLQHIPYQLILRRNGSMADMAADYESWLYKAMVDHPRRVAVLGIGADGHTAGILPMPHVHFNQLLTDHLVVGYTSERGQHRQRITITPKALQRCTDIVVIAMGEAKRPVLHHLLSGEIAPVWEFPAGLLRDHLHVKIFTDVKL